MWWQSNAARLAAAWSNPGDPELHPGAGGDPYAGLGGAGQTVVLTCTHTKDIHTAHCVPFRYLRRVHTHTHTRARNHMHTVSTLSPSPSKHTYTRTHWAHGPRPPTRVSALAGVGHSGAVAACGALGTVCDVVGAAHLPVHAHKGPASASN